MKAILPKGMGKGAGNQKDMMRQAQQMQTDMAALSEELEEKEYEANSGGGAVVATVTGAKKVISVKINPEIIDADDAEMLEDLVIVAVNAALEAADNDEKEQMKEITGGMSIPGLF